VDRKFRARDFDIVKVMGWELLQRLRRASWNELVSKFLVETIPGIFGKKLVSQAPTSVLPPRGLRVRD
jgi:hypothetical protein